MVDEPKWMTDSGDEPLDGSIFHETGEIPDAAGLERWEGTVLPFSRHLVWTEQG